MVTISRNISFVTYLYLFCMDFNIISFSFLYSSDLLQKKNKFFSLNNVFIPYHIFGWFWNHTKTYLCICLKNNLVCIIHKTFIMQQINAFLVKYRILLLFYRSSDFFLTFNHLLVKNKYLVLNESQWILKLFVFDHWIFRMYTQNYAYDFFFSKRATSVLIYSKYTRRTCLLIVMCLSAFTNNRASTNVYTVS